MLRRDTVLSDHLFDELASVAGVRLRSNKNLESLIATNLDSYRRSFIVIDGLDEAAPGEPRKTLDWLLSLVNGGLQQPRASLRILISGQRDGNLDYILCDQWASIALESYQEHTKDIHRYCIHMVDQIQQKFGKSITSTIKDEIISRVVGQAKGEFPSVEILTSLTSTSGRNVSLRSSCLREPSQSDKAFPAEAGNGAGDVPGWPGSSVRTYIPSTHAAPSRRRHMPTYLLVMIQIRESCQVGT